MKKLNFRDIAKKIASCLQDKKAADILIFDVKDKSSIADYFVLATARSNSHVNALVDYTKGSLLAFDVLPFRREGLFKDTRWAVTDFGNIIVHIFTADIRAEYNLENLWRDAKTVKWETKSDKKTLD